MGAGAIVSEYAHRRGHGVYVLGTSGAVMGIAVRYRESGQVPSTSANTISISISALHTTPHHPLVSLSSLSLPLFLPQSLSLPHEHATGRGHGDSEDDEGRAVRQVRRRSGRPQACGGAGPVAEEGGGATEDGGGQHQPHRLEDPEGHAPAVPPHQVPLHASGRSGRRGRGAGQRRDQLQTRRQGHLHQLPERRWARRVRGGASGAHGGEAAGGVGCRGRLPAGRRQQRGPAPQGHRGQLRQHVQRHRPQERAGDRGLGRRGPLRGAAGQAGRPARHGHLRRAQRRLRPGPGRRRGAGLQDARGRRAAEPVGQEVRRGGELRGGGGVAGAQGGAGRRGRHGRGRHAGGPRGAHVAPAEGDVRQEEAGAADADAEEGGDGVAGGPGEAGEAQDGGGLEVPAGQGAGGVGEERRRARHRQDRRGNRRRRMIMNH